jgi:hypothetical protein
MSQKSLLTAMLVFAALVAGCGDGEGASTDHVSGITGVLIDLQDLPGHSQVAEDLPEPCGPLEVFEPKASETALSKMFVVGKDQARVKEAVASFDRTPEARKAFEALDFQNRQECIVQAILQLSPGGSKVGVEPSRDLPLADEARLTNYIVIRPTPENPGSVAAISLRAGSCVAALLVLVEGTRSDEDLVRSLAGLAGDLLERRC